MTSPVAGYPDEAQVRDALTEVVDPELGDNIVALGMVRGIQVAAERIEVELALTTASCPLRSQLRDAITGCLTALPGVEDVHIKTVEMEAEERSALMARARWKARDQAVETDIPASARILAIASGKGGVGKSSVTVNLAAALARRGAVVGVLDADIWGFSVPRMLGMEGDISVEAGKMVPLRKDMGSGRLKILSMGFLSNEDEAIMWRGLMLNRAVQHFLEDVQWGTLDYLLIDMPPGTGDVQMGLARMLPRAEMLIVTTPALAAQNVAARAADMARRGYLRVTGVIENMAPTVDAAGNVQATFGEGGGLRLAREIEAPLVGSIPLDPTVSKAGDVGVPVEESDGPAGRAFAALAERLMRETAELPEDMEGCTARILDRVDEALAVVDGNDKNS